MIEEDLLRKKERIAYLRQRVAELEKETKLARATLEAALLNLYWGKMNLYRDAD